MKYFLILFLSLMSFIISSNKLYYYGSGFCFLCKKLPERFEVVKNFKSDGYMLIENIENGVIICKEYFFRCEKKQINVLKFKGYWFNQDSIICEILDDKNSYRLFVITNQKYNKAKTNKVLIKEVSKSTNQSFVTPDLIDFKSMTYVDLTNESTNSHKFNIIFSLILIIFCLLKIFLKLLVFKKQ